MKKLVIITGIILIACTFVNAVGAYQSEPEQAGKNTIYNETVTTIVQTDESNAEPTYILKAENDKLVVYEKGQSKPFMEFDRAISSLPQGDVLRLERGIEVYGKENLKKSIEDYCS